MANPKEPRRQEVLTWEDVDKLVDVLLPQLRSAGPFDAMVMITRGGIVPGGLLAEALDIKHLLTAAVDFPAKEEAGLMAWPTFLQFPGAELLEGRRALVVDDVWGSGRTSTAVVERVRAATDEAYTCVFHFNPYRSLFSKHEPDFYGAITDAYIVYPWETDRGVYGIGLRSPEIN
ncbi:MAG: phosphoribosyltransferase [Chloroflexi bacterium]|nr:MAG: phosphoribosyltransferase [Chloroflexota bacterium]